MRSGHPNAIVPYEESLGWAFGNIDETDEADDCEDEDEYFPVVYGIGDRVEVRFLGDLRWLPGVVVQHDPSVPTELVRVRVDLPLETNPRKSTKVDGIKIDNDIPSDTIIISGEVEFLACFVRPVESNELGRRVVCRENAYPVRFYDVGAYQRGDYVEVRLISSEEDESPSALPFEWRRGRVSLDRRDGTYDVRLESGVDLRAVAGCHLRHHFRPRDVVDCRIASLLATDADYQGHIANEEVDAIAAASASSGAGNGTTEKLNDLAPRRHHRHRRHSSHSHDKHHRSKHHHKHRHHHRHKHDHHESDQSSSEAAEQTARGIPLTALPPTHPCEWRGAVVVRQEKSGLYVLSVEDGSRLRDVDPRRLMPASRAEVRAAAEERRVCAQTWCPRYPPTEPDASVPVSRVSMYTDGAPREIELPSDERTARFGVGSGSHDAEEEEGQRLGQGQGQSKPHKIVLTNRHRELPRESQTQAGRIVPAERSAPRPLPRPATLQVAHAAPTPGPTPPRTAIPAVIRTNAQSAQPTQSGAAEVLEFPAGQAAVFCGSSSQGTLTGSTDQPEGSTRAARQFDINDRVEVEQPHASGGRTVWLPGRVHAVHPDGTTCLVRFTDGKREVEVPEQGMRRRRSSLQGPEPTQDGTAPADAHIATPTERSGPASTPLDGQNYPVEEAALEPAIEAALQPSAVNPSLSDSDNGSPHSSPTPASPGSAVDGSGPVTTPPEMPLVLDPPTTAEVDTTSLTVSSAAQPAPPSPLAIGAPLLFPAVTEGSWLSVFNAATKCYEPCVVEASYPEGTFDARNLRGDLHVRIDGRYVQSGAASSAAGSVALSPPMAAPRRAVAAHSPVEGSRLPSEPPSFPSPGTALMATGSATAPTAQGAPFSVSVGSRVEAQLSPYGQWLSAVVVQQMGVDAFMVYMEDAGQEAIVLSTSLRPIASLENHGFHRARELGFLPGDPAHVDVQAGLTLLDACESSLDGSLDDDSLVVLGTAPPPALQVLYPDDPLSAGSGSFRREGARREEVDSGNEPSESGNISMALNATRPHSVPTGSPSPRSRGKLYCRSAEGDAVHVGLAAGPMGGMAETHLRIPLPAEKPVTLKARIALDKLATPRLDTAEPVAPRLVVLTQSRCCLLEPCLVVVAAEGPIGLFPGDATLAVTLACEHFPGGMYHTHLRWPATPTDSGKAEAVAILSVAYTSEATERCAVRVSLYFQTLLTAEVDFEAAVSDAVSTSPANPKVATASLRPTRPSAERPSSVPYLRRPTSSSVDRDWVRLSAPFLPRSLAVVVCGSPSDLFGDASFLDNALGAAASALEMRPHVSVVRLDRLDRPQTDAIAAEGGLIQIIVASSTGLRRQDWMKVLKQHPALQAAARQHASRVRISALSATVPLEGHHRSGNWLTSFGMTALDLTQQSLRTGDPLCLKLWLRQRDSAARLRYVSSLKALNSALSGRLARPPGMLLLPTTLCAGYTGATPTASTLFDELCALTERSGVRSEGFQHNEDPGDFADWTLHLLSDYEEVITLDTSAGLSSSDLSMLMPLLKATASLALVCVVSYSQHLPDPAGPQSLACLARDVPQGAWRELLSAYRAWEVRQQLGAEVDVGSVLELESVEGAMGEVTRALEDSLLTITACAPSWGQSVAAFVAARRMHEGSVILIGHDDVKTSWLAGEALHRPPWSTIQPLLRRQTEYPSRLRWREAFETFELPWRSVAEQSLGAADAVAASLKHIPNCGHHAACAQSPVSHPTPAKPPSHSELVAVFTGEAGIRDAFSAQEAVSCLQAVGCGSLEDLLDAGTLFRTNDGAVDGEGLRSFLKDSGIPLFVAAKITAYLQRCMSVPRSGQVVA